MKRGRRAGSSRAPNSKRRMAEGRCLATHPRSVAGRIAPPRPTRSGARHRRQFFYSRRIGGKKTGPNPTDRRKLGSKHHLIVEAQGIPLAVILSGANCHDIKQLNALVSAIPPIRGKPGRPLRKPDIAQDDRGYSSNKHRQALREQGIVPELTRIGAPHAVAAWAKRAGSSSALLRGCITIDA